MRIACIHVPQFALQCATRLDPSLRGEPVAVVSSLDPQGEVAGRRSVLHAPIVLACSRAAWALGVRLGMTATAARGLSTSLQIVTAEPATEREAVRAIADSLLAVTPVVDLGGRVGAGGAHLAMYVEVPAKMRGTSFGDRLVELLGELGFSARIGIADDRFTAWVAAAHAGTAAPTIAAGHARSTRQGHDAHGAAAAALGTTQGSLHVDDPAVVTVPRGGSAAFLSPRPLSLLAISPEVQHMLEALGVRTLGEFAALPAPSVARPLEADYQALARGDSGTHLRPYTPEAPIREEVVVSAGNVLELDGSVGGPAAIALVARRIALRLAGRGRSAARLEVTVIQDGEPVDVPVSLDHAHAHAHDHAHAIIDDAEAVARALGPVLERTSAHRGAWRLRVLVAGEAIVGGEVASETLAEGSSPFVAAHTAPGILATSRRGRAAAPALASSDEPAPDLGAVELDATLSPLAVVLSSPGSLFALSPPVPANDRREPHRRTRRGKQRRMRPTAPIQPRLFERTSSK